LGRLIELNLLLSSSAEEDFALGKKSSRHGGKGRDTGSSPEQCAPGGVWDKVQVDDSGNEVSDSVSLLEDTASKTTSLDRDVFEGGGGGQTPDTSHADTEETSYGEELLERLNEAGAEGEDGDEEEIGDQRPLSAKSVREETEDDL
jgi:hypothetical protein